MAVLDGIFNAERERRLATASSLEALRARLDGAPPPAPDEPDPAGAIARRPGPPPGRRFVPLPRRTTHGGRWGRSVAEKLRREALR